MPEQDIKMVITEIHKAFDNGFERIESKMQTHITAIRQEIKEATKPEIITGFPLVDHVQQHTLNQDIVKTMCKIKTTVSAGLIGTLLLAVIYFVWGSMRLNAVEQDQKNNKKDVTIQGRR